MKTKIYYFSATGNSLAVGKTLAKMLHGDVELIAIKEVVQEGKPIEITGDKAGLIYPVYSYGSPRIVNEFINLISKVDIKYFFTIGTCGGNPAGALGLMKKRLARVGIEQNSGFAISMETPEGGDDFAVIPFMIKISGKSVRDWAEREKEIVSAINNTKSLKEENQNIISRFFGRIFYPMALHYFPILDSNFYTNDKCKGCGICSRVCPSKNITLEDNKPKWHGNCEQCIGCMQWCPSKAIQNCEESINHRKYHHPDIKLKELVG